MSRPQKNTLQDLLRELRPPYADQDHLTSILDTLGMYFERPWRESTSAEIVEEAFRPILGEYLRLSDEAREELLACLCHLFDPYSDDKPNLDLAVIKDNLQILAPSALVCAISLIANERAPDAQTRIRPFLDHGKDFVREAAQEELEEMALKP